MVRNSYHRRALKRYRMASETEPYLRVEHLSKVYHTRDGDVRALILDIVVSPSFRQTLVEED